MSRIPHVEGGCLVYANAEVAASAGLLKDCSHQPYSGASSVSCRLVISTDLVLLRGVASHLRGFASQTSAFDIPSPGT